jgi:hypothetical protein
MKSEDVRKTFHLKNRKMYTRFIEINHDLYFNLKQNIVEENSYVFSLSVLENIISDTYDRKQREIEKAMNKIKSIILNHEELKVLFNYGYHNIYQIFFESIDYAYRRNLPKRCKQMKSRIN